MADTKTTALSGFTPIGTDLLYGVDDPGGTPISGKLTLNAAMDAFFPPLEAGGRLTLTTGVPVTTTDVTGAATLYYTPYTHNRIALYDGSRWVRYAFTERSLAVGTLASVKPHDVFLYDNSGTLTLEFLIWTNDTTRATTLTRQDGVLCKTGALTRRWLGTVYPSATTTLEDSNAKRWVYNASQRVPRTWRKQDTTDSWTYNSTTIRQANGSAANQIDGMFGDPGGADLVDVMVFSSVDYPHNVLQGATVTIGLDGTTPSSLVSGYNVQNIVIASPPTGDQIGVTLNPRLITNPGVGRHYCTWLEAAQTTNGNLTFYGDAGGAVNATINSGIFGVLLQ